MRRTKVAPDAVASAIQIVTAARRRCERVEKLRGIAPVIALGVGLTLCLTTMAALAAAPAALPFLCAASGSCQ
ncbi:MAG TPA: hypothetical protein VE591_12590 [Candidatus Acidoferrum sp.]|jgi:hypothetical protein|nr:hypothetical protein [Candidatus Acidoferrum sp.]